MQLTNKSNQEVQWDYYLKKENGITVGWIRCSVLSEIVKNPQCRYEFDHKDQYAHAISFDGDFLTQWHDIEESVLEFFEQHRVKYENGEG